ncbi:MAG: hypothetical protein ACMV1B_05760 [Prevotella sp.]
MEKALDILGYIRNNDYIMDLLDKTDIDEAISELEEAMKPKTCEGCSNLEDIGKSYKHCKELCINISHSTESTFYCNRYEAKG